MNRFLLWLFCTAYTANFYASYAALDTAFNGTGFAFNATQSPSNWTSQQQTCCALQPDGKILVAGNAIGSTAIGGGQQVAIVRFNSNGTRDTTFNATGSPAFTGSQAITATPGYLIYTVPGNYAASGYSSAQSTFGIAVQTDGKILVTGSTTTTGLDNPTVFIVKFTASGVLDTTFGIGGSTGIITNTGATSGIGSTVGVYGNTGSIVFYSSYYGCPSYAILPQSDNTIILAGQRSLSNPTVIKFTSTGALDSTFGTTASGYTSIAAPGSQGVNGSLIKAITTDTSANLYMAGQYNPSSSISTLSFYPVLFKCSSTGVLNTNYGSPIYPSGSVVGAIISSNTATIQGSFNGVVVQPDGKAVAIGTASFGSLAGITYYMVIARFTTQGLLDTTFGNGVGYIVNQLCSTGISININENAQYIVTGKLAANNNYSVIARYTNDGVLDTTFASNGYITFSGSGYTPNNLLGNFSSSDGKIHIGATINGYFGAFQLLGNNILQSTIPNITAYGYNSDDFQEFLYVANYAQVITSATAQSATISGVNALLDSYTTTYAAQPDFNYILYLYLLLPQLETLQTSLLTEYSSSGTEINQFFSYLTDRINALSSIQN